MIQSFKQLFEQIILNQNLTNKFSKLPYNNNIKAKQCLSNFFNSLKLTNQKQMMINN